MMDKNALESLEYPKIRELLRDSCTSKSAKKMADELDPSKEMDEIERLQEETQAAKGLISEKGNPPLFGIRDLSPSLKRLSLGGSLSPKDLLEVNDLLRVSRALRDYSSEIEDKNLMTEMISTLYTNQRLENEIDRIIISEDEISDDASPELRRIRREKVLKSEAIRSKLQRTISNKKEGDILQEQIVTIRDGRYVLPVKASNKSQVPGIVHDRSSTGSTIYIEPMFVVELNNELRLLDSDEEEEISRILENLSKRISDYRGELRENQKTLVELDFIFARAKLSLSMRGERPSLNRGGLINIEGARHPLLNGKVVPIDISLGADFNILVITGPNTGGKTVSLKTLGLLTLMAQSGLQIPVKKANMAVFDQVFTDIGDKQSIEQSLSTFSASMTNIVRILNSIDENALILFDELGAGTDPTEGAALAMAILDHLKKNPSLRIVASTHFSQLKLYALEKEGVENASVEFDIDSLSPTYRLIIGSPGKSNAFEISKRLGLSQDIIGQAEDFISEEDSDFEDVLGKIEEDRQKAEEARLEADKAEQENKNLKRKLERELEKQEKERDKILDQARLEAKQILNKAKEEGDKLIKSLREIDSPSQSARDRKIQGARDEFKQTMDSLKGDSSSLDLKSNKAPERVKPGDEVRVLAFNQVGTVLSEADKNGDIQVQLGILKVTANIKNVEKVNKKPEEDLEENVSRLIRDKKNKDTSPDLDLRGMTVDEALDSLSKRIDDALLLGMPYINIIHGKGTGALRKAVQDYLKSNKNVESYRLGKPEEGGSGVTICQF